LITRREKKDRKKEKRNFFLKNKKIKERRFGVNFRELVTTNLFL
jgi:hypothetical protein